MITTAVIGMGSMGNYHAQVYSQLPNAKLVGLADIDPQVSENASQRYGIKVYLDYRKMLEVERPQAISVTVPTALHEEITIAALTAGAHVLVEKPIADTLESGTRMGAAAHQMQRGLMVGHIERFNPTVRRLKDELQAGRLGQVYQIACRRVGPFNDRVHDVGVVMDLAIHDLDMLTFLIERLPQQVFARVSHHRNSLYEDALLGLLDYTAGPNVLLDVNWLSPVRVREVRVFGEYGLLHANTLTQELTFYQNDVTFPLPVVRANPLALELDAFLQAVESGRRDFDMYEQNLSALTLALALLESGKCGKPRSISAAQPMPRKG